MKCKNCGGEIANGTKFCEFCGAQISAEMKKEQEYVNKEGCPKCGSANITFSRENQGVVKKEKNNKAKSQVIHATVGVCKDCGYTWETSNTNLNSGSGKTWLWVLGWICIFPVPLMILLRRENCQIKDSYKKIIIAAAWILYLILLIASNNKETNNTSTVSTVSETSVVSVEEQSKENSKVADESLPKEESKEESKDESVIDPDFKEFMDSYEEVMNEYCDFMEKYDSNDPSMITGYLSILNKYQDYCKKLDKYDEKEMNALETAYYLEVTARVNERLAKVAVNMT